jgi:hypoxanthine phosphoribosyltransferase
MKRISARAGREQVPPRLRAELSDILIGREQIARRVKQLSRQIQKDFAKRDLVIVSLLNGTVLFLADLIRNLEMPLRLDFVGVSSYGAGTESGALVFTKELRLDVKGRDVLLVDDILDTGKTLNRVIEKLRDLEPRRIKVCVLLDKRSRREYRVRADYRWVPHSRRIRCGLRIGLRGAVPKPPVHWHPQARDLFKRIDLLAVVLRGGGIRLDHGHDR